MYEAWGDGGLCPRCGRSASRDGTTTDGRFAHHATLGMHVDGNRLDASLSIHRFLGAVMNAGGRTVCDDAVASAVDSRGSDATKGVAVMASMAKNAIAAIGIDTPFERIRGEGNRWIGTGRPLVRSVPRLSICPGCGYNLHPEAPIGSGPFAHDPATGRATIHGVEMRGSSQLHSLLGTFMRGTGTVLTSDVIADRLGSDSDDPAGMITTLVCLLRRSCRHHGVQLPLRSIFGLGYVWTEERTVTGGTYMGPPVPARIRLGTPSGPDLSDLLSEREGGSHTCGCPLGTPSLSSDGWMWSRQDGLHHEGSLIAAGAKANVAGAVMAASGRYVHAAMDLDHIIGGDPSNAGDHLNVIMSRLRSSASENGSRIPMEARHGHGVRWTGSAPRLYMPDPAEDCPGCLRRTAALTRLGIEAVRPPKHPESLMGGPLLLADLLSSCGGRTVATTETLSMLDSKGDERLTKVYVCHIRRAYREAGLPDPIQNVRGLGYRWTGGRPADEGQGTPPTPHPAADSADASADGHTVHEAPTGFRPREDGRDRRGRVLPTSATERMIRMLRLSRSNVHVMAARRRSRGS